MDVLLGLGFLAAMYFLSTTSDQDWRQAAADLDLRYSKKVTGGRTLSGTLRGFDVEVATASSGKNNATIVVEVRGVDPGFTLGPDSALLRPIKPDIETGDRLFDERTRIEGDTGRALALLGVKARRLAETLITVSQGELRGRVLRSRLSTIDQATSTLETMLELAQLLRRPRDNEIPELLIEQALHDPFRGVRLRAFRQLSTSNPRSQRTLSTAEQLLGSRFSGLRFEASRALLKAGPERSAGAAQVLLDLVSLSVADSSIRRSALQTLIKSRYRRSAIPAMVEILHKPELEQPGIRRDALEGLIRARAKNELLKVVPDGSGESEILARGLGRLDLSAQPQLLQLLEHPKDRVRSAAIGSLKRIGDLSSIAALRQVAGLDTLFKSSVAQAAEHAIGVIKSRAGGSQQGEISLATVAPLDGAISQADDSEAGGEVSLTP